MIDQEVTEIAARMYGVGKYTMEDLYNIAAHKEKGTLEQNDDGSYTPIELLNEGSVPVGDTSPL